MKGIKFNRDGLKNKFIIFTYKAKASVQVIQAKQANAENLSQELEILRKLQQLQSEIMMKINSFARIVLE